MQLLTYVTDVVLPDVIGFSQLSTPQQHATVTLITDQTAELIRTLFDQALIEPPEVLLATVPTGDGFYLLLHHEFAGYGVLLAMSLRSGLLLAAKRHNSSLEGLRMPSTRAHRSAISLVIQITLGMG